MAIYQWVEMSSRDNIASANRNHRQMKVPGDTGKIKVTIIRNWHDLKMLSRRLNNRFPIPANTTNMPFLRKAINGFFHRTV